MAAGAGLLPGRPGNPRVPAALPAGELLGGVPQQRPAEPPHGLRGQPEIAVSAALEKTAVLHGPFDLREGAGRHGSILSELAGEGVQVQVIEA
ncbi:hypothetical protein SRABI128_04873 [Microbacterium sp. Bi128]|nr:hypothetical protein SRABI128_04873 [Microbacterium sp. Bi128]